jgi:hypothetical protein
MFPGCEKNLLIVKNRERRFSNIKVYENNLQTLQNDFADFQDAMSKGAQFLIIDSNVCLPEHYQQSYEVLSRAITTIEGVYRPQGYDEVMEINRSQIQKWFIVTKMYLQFLLAKQGAGCVSVSKQHPMSQTGSSEGKKSIVCHLAQILQRLTLKKLLMTFGGLTVGIVSSLLTYKLSRQQPQPVANNNRLGARSNRHSKR